MTYFDVGGRSILLLGVELLCRLFVGWVLEVRTEQAQVLLLLSRVLLLLLVELGVDALNFLANHARVPDSDVVVGTARNLLAKVLQALR